MGPQPKRCHHCKSVDHLIADCPSRSEKKSIKDKSTNNNNNDDCCCDNNKDLRHTTVHLGKVLLVKEEEDDEDDEDVQLHDHRINCSSSPASSCSSPLGKRELMWFSSLMDYLQGWSQSSSVHKQWLNITKKKFLKINKSVWFNQLHGDNIIWHTIYCTDLAERFSKKWSLTSRSWRWLSWHGNVLQDLKF